VRIITFYNSTAVAKTLSWVVDRDLAIVGTFGASSQAVLSEEPDLTWALHSTAPAADSVETRLRLTLQTWTGYSLLIPFKKDSKIFVAFTAVKGYVAIVVDDVEDLLS
jgi:hypothetical protein